MARSKGPKAEDATVGPIGDLERGMQTLLAIKPRDLSALESARPRRAKRKTKKPAA